MTSATAGLAQALVRSGLRHAFGVCGSGLSLGLIEQLEMSGATYHPVGHEAAAAIMAGTAWKASGLPSVSISIKGPGVANSFPGIVHNFFESNPSLSISEAFGDDVPSFRRHKRLDHAGVLAGVLKGFADLAAVEEDAERVIATAAAEVPGPVHLDLCRHDGLAKEDTPKPPADNVKDRLRALELVRRARQPVVVVGSLSKRRPWGETLSNLEIPVLTTVAAKGVLDERLPQSAGLFTGAGSGVLPEVSLLRRCDLVVGIGLRNTEVVSPRRISNKVVIIDDMDGPLHDGFGAEVSVAGSRGFVEEVLDVLRLKNWGLDFLVGLRAPLRELLLDHEWSPATCFEALEALPYDHAVVVDTGAFCTIGEHFLSAGPHQPFLGSGNGRYMGVSIPAAVGLSIARPGLPVFCVLGDGGMQSYPGEIRTAVAEQLPICFLLIRDDRYTSVATAAASSVRSTGAYLVSQPAWAQCVEGMSCAATTVGSKERIFAALGQWDRSAPYFIEAQVDADVVAELSLALG